MKKHRVFSLFTVIFVAFLLFQSVTIVPTGYTGVKTSFGQIQEATIQSGKLNFTIPFVQSIHTVSNKQQDKHIEAQIWGEASDKTPVYGSYKENRDRWSDGGVPCQRSRAEAVSH